MRASASSAANEFPTGFVILLGILIAIGPLCIDMYLPALPAMAQDLGVSVAYVSSSIPAYFTGLVIGQLFYGPWADRVGRKRPLYLGMGLFVLASVGCALAQNVPVLMVSRALQALGACVTAVISRAMIRDIMTTMQMARAFSLMVLVMGIAPIIAPSLGAVLLAFGSWRLIFWFLVGYGVLNLVITHFLLDETLPKRRRNHSPMRASLGQYKALFFDARFLYPALGGGLMMGSFFVYISAASPLFMLDFGLSDTTFARVFGMNALGFIAMTQINGYLTKQVSLLRLLKIGAISQLVFAFILTVCAYIMGDNLPLWLVIACVFFCIMGLGLTQPNATALALLGQKERAGTASALAGALQFCVGIFGGALTGLIGGSHALKLGAVISILIALGTLLVFLLPQHEAVD